MELEPLGEGPFVQRKRDAEEHAHEETPDPAPERSRASGLLDGVSGYKAQREALSPVGSGGIGVQRKALSPIHSVLDHADHQGPDLASHDAEASPSERATPASQSSSESEGKESKSSGQKIQRKSMGTGPSTLGGVRVGAPNDSYEQQADAVASRVLSSSNAAMSETAHCPDCGSKMVDKGSGSECKDCGTKGSSIQRKAEAGASSSDSAPALSAPGGGAPLSENVRSRVEPVLGADLSSVRVHTNAAAQADAKAVQAKAFTHGNNIWLGKGQSPNDVGLMAHEATHVVQQRSTPGLQRKIQRKSLAERVLPDWVLNLAKRAKSAISGGPGKMKAKAAEGESKGIAEVEGTAAEGEGKVQEAGSEGEKSLSDAEAKGMQAGAQAGAKTDQAQSKAMGDAQGIQKEISGAGDAMDPGMVASGGLVEEIAKGGVDAAAGGGAGGGGTEVEVQENDGGGEPTGPVSHGSSAEPGGDAELKGIEPDAEGGGGDLPPGMVEVQGNGSPRSEQGGPSRDGGEIPLMPGVDPQVLTAPGAGGGLPNINPQGVATGPQAETGPIGLPDIDPKNAATGPQADVGPVDLPKIDGKDIGTGDWKLDGGGGRAPSPTPSAPEGPTAVPSVDPKAGGVDGEAIAREAANAAKGAHDGAAGGGWDCSEKQIIGKLTKFKDSVLNGMVSMVRRLPGGEHLLDFASKTASGIKQAGQWVKKAAGDVAKKVKGFIEEKTRPLRKMMGEAKQAAKKVWDTSTDFVSKKYNSVKDWAAKKWDSAKDGIKKRLSGAADKIKSKVSAIASSIKSKAGKFWGMLPGWVRGPIEGAGTAIATVVALPAIVASKVGKFVAKHKDKILAFGKKILDIHVKMGAHLWKAVSDSAKYVGGKIGDAAKWVGSTAKSLASKAYGVVDRLSGGRISKLRKASQEKLAEQKGAACALLGETAGPCVEQMLPDVTGGAGSFSATELKGTGTVSAWIYGVPVEIAAGYSILLAKTDKKKYTVTLKGECTGQAKAQVDQQKGGGWNSAAPGAKGVSIGITGTLPAKAASVMKLSGGPAPIPTIPIGGAAAASGATPAASGAGAAPAPAAAAAADTGTGVSASVGAGKKGVAEMTYTFDATADKTSCDGLGGLTAFLAGQGMGHVLPMPFGAMAQGLTAGAFADKLTSQKVTWADVASGSLEAKAGGVGSGNIGVSMERGTTLEWKKQDIPASADKKGPMGQGDEKGMTKKAAQENVVSATLYQKLSGTAGGKLAPGGVEFFSAVGTIGTDAQASLAYHFGQDKISAGLSASVSASVGVTGFSSFASLLPGSIASQVRRNLQGFGSRANSGTIGVSYKAEVLNLETLAADLDSYFQNPDSVTASGVWDRVDKYIKTPGNLKSTWTIVLDLKENVIGVNIGANDGKGTGGSVGATLDRSQHIVLYTGSG